MDRQANHRGRKTDRYSHNLRVDGLKVLSNTVPPTTADEQRQQWENYSKYLNDISTDYIN
jgi:hypothetical protein